MSAAADRLLEGVRVVDLTSVIMGPYCTKMLADLGADVIKVEPPGGDITRDRQEGRHRGMSPLFLNVNHGKRSVTLDLKRADDIEALRRLVGTADVFVHNIRSDSAARLGIDYASVSSWNPSVVYCSTLGFGTGGPYERDQAYDDVVQGASGVAHVQSVASGHLSYVSCAVADKAVGVLALSAILAALYRRAGTGIGCELEVPMFEAMVDYVSLEHLAGLTFEPPVNGSLDARTVAPQRRPIATLDGAVCPLVYDDRDWARLLSAAGRHDVVDDPRLADMTTRIQHMDFTYGLLAEILGGLTTKEAVALLKDLDIAVTPMNSIDDLIDDPHLRAVGMFDVVDHPTEGRIRVTRSPVIVDRTRNSPRRLAPRLGEHTREVFEALGLQADEIDRLGGPSEPGGPERG